MRETAIVERVQFITYRESATFLSHVTVRVNGADVGKLTMDDHQLLAFSTLFAPTQYRSGVQQ